MKKLIFLLKQEKVSNFFETKAIRSFIKMVWAKYKIAIVNRVFIWNILYLFSFIILAYCQLDYMPYIGDISENFLVDLLFSFNLLLTLSLMVFNFRIEYKKVSQNREIYFDDFWNILDLVSNTINMGVIICLCSRFLFKFQILGTEKLRVVAAIGCFCMWMKSFYWLRLFHQTAYFVKLITETFQDVKIFMLILILIIIAFANSFSFMDADSANPIITKHTSFAAFNSFLSVWLMMLGEYDVEGMSNAPFGSFICWIFFIVGTFVLILMGSNMLIAIMSDTFTKVYTIQT